MTDAGRLHGEIVMGHDMVRELIDEDPEFPPEAAKLLRHIIVAHHGMREKGSPVVPQTREAVIVHYCDDMTARIGAIDDAEAAAPAGERWTSRIFMIDAPAYLGPRDEPTTRTSRSEYRCQRAAVGPAPSRLAPDLPAVGQHCRRMPLGLHRG